MTTRDDLIDRLAAHKTLGSAPREELAWLADHGELRTLDTDEVLTRKGVRVDGLFVVLSGRIAIFVDRGAGLHKVMEWRDGEVTGVLPYSRIVAPPADTVAQEPTTLVAIHRDHLRAMTRECYEVTSLLVHTMLDRARAFTSSDLHDEKLVSLGKLSAGLAHELNNPASAIERGATLLQDRFEDAERAAHALGAAGLSEAQLATVDEVRHTCAVARQHGVRSPIEEAEREEAIADWLADRQLEAALAEPLAETALTQATLDHLAAAIDGPALAAAVRWIAAGCSARSITSDVLDASVRISGLVTAIKGFTHMDQAPVAEPVDLLQSLSNTLAVLRAKARSKSIAVVIDVAPDVPPVHGFTGELNQIWANLIDNALDAVGESGRVEVLARRDRQRIAVSIVDNGAGISAAVRERMFDPFFTTKPVGQGTGLGLDIVRRLVRHNDGEIAVESAPGRTEFRVLLPVGPSGVGAGTR